MELPRRLWPVRPRLRPEPRRRGAAPAASRIAAVASALLVAALAVGCSGAGGADRRAGPTSSPPDAAGSAGHAAGSTQPSPTSPVPGGSGPLGAVAGKVIVIDPGHNGGNAAHPEVVDRHVDAVTGTKPCDTTGTLTNGGYTEAEFSFDVGNRLAAVLRAAGARVVLTRTTNTGVGPCITERAAIGNRHHAAVSVSIHADGAPAGSRGFHVIEPADVGGPSTPIVAESHLLALRIRDAYRARTPIPPAGYIGTDGINTRRDMGGLNLSTVPKVLVECGNMRNAADAATMVDPAGRQRIAQALAEGVAVYLAADAGGAR